jgi:hypothetical protein
MMINMTITIKRITNNYKHKRKRMRTTKIITKRIMDSCNQQKRGSLVVEKAREKG